MSTRRSIGLALAVGAVALWACSWDGPNPGVQVVAAPDSEDPSPGAVDVPFEAAPAASSLPDAAPTGSTPPSTVDLSRVTLPPGGRRPLPADLPATVAVVGDSLTLSAQEEIESALGALGIDVIAIDGAENRRMAHGDDPPPGLDSITAISEEATPALWVLALGTNDVGAQADRERFADDVSRLLEEIPERTPVVWVDIFIRDRQPAVEVANQALRDVLAQRPRAIVADWFSKGDDDGVVTVDGVHLTPDGQQAFAATIVDAVLALSG